MKTFSILISTVILLSPVFVQAQGVTIAPSSIIQGDPVMVTADKGAKKIIFDNSVISSFPYDGKVRAFIPIGLTKRPGNYLLRVEWSNGHTVERTIVVGERKKMEVPLGIPEKLGGNTTVSQNNLVSTLAKENATLENIRTHAQVLWSKPFQFPLKEVVVTDPYGYSRKTGDYSIAHKGTDFRAKEGTEVLAMNNGVVQVARTYTIYGKTIIIDHGLGVQTFYMHLSKINVKAGDMVKAGQVIGLSGKTGYAEEPHLHLTLRIQGQSVDAMRFMEFFK